ncbi:hypothetical protein NPIL_684711 [Nephila pilipes]|uniref:Gem-associated protein 2 n=1 Tax=Nephila pilipes TaxID=299642 RepID=A0A8X6NX09_NEPPI|nr:hypothetical protein NPIL_684711 [Nephila pilipes]
MFEYRSDLKKKFERKTFPHADKFEEWCVYCLGLDKYRVLYGEVESETSYDTKAAEDSKKGVKSMIRKGDIEPHQPLLSIVLHMRRRHVIRVLMYHIAWMEVLGFSHCQGEWLYALLVALDTPLYPDTCAMIRNLSRLCSKLRSELTSPKDKFLKPLNMILSIISVYFDQKDMSDNFMEY